MRRLILPLVMVSAAVACSGDDAVTVTSSQSGPTTTLSAGTAPAPSEATTTRATETTPSSTAVEPVIEVEHQPGEGKFEGALDDVEFDCASDGATWTAEGTATNSAAAAASYRIFMAFTDPAGETVALIETQVEAVEPGDSAEWSVEFASAAVDLTCVPRVERRPA